MIVVLFRKERIKSTQKIIKREVINLECPYTFGYLTYLPKSVSVPEQCMFCLSLIDCRYNSKNWEFLLNWMRMLKKSTKKQT